MEHHLITWFEDGATDLFGWRCTGCMDEFVGFSDPISATNHGLAEHDKTDTPAEAESVEEDWSVS
jgi:hypothetical protein